MDWRKNIKHRCNTWTVDNFAVQMVVQERTPEDAFQEAVMFQPGNQMTEKEKTLLHWDLTYRLAHFYVKAKFKELLDD